MGYYLSDIFWRYLILHRHLADGNKITVCTLSFTHCNGENNEVLHESSLTPRLPKKLIYIEREYLYMVQNTVQIPANHI